MAVHHFKIYRHLQIKMRMMLKKNKGKIKLLPLGELGILNDLKSLTSWDTDGVRALKISLEERGNHTPYTAVESNGSHVLVNGRTRYDIELELHGPEYVVPVWVLEGKYTADELQYIIFDFDKRKKKSTLHCIDEYEFLDARLPKNQGKKNAEGLRKNEIARRIGISTSKLDQIKRLNSANPSLLRMVDTGVMTLKKALSEAKLIEQMIEQQEQNSSIEESETVPIQREINAKNHHVDLNAVMTNCPCCGLSFDRIEWTDVPQIFNYRRGEDEKQTDWLLAA